MNYKKILIAAMSVIMLTACGNTAETETSSEPPVTNEVTTEKEEATTEAVTTSEAEKTTAEKSTKKKTEKTTTVEETTKTDNTTTVAKDTTVANSSSASTKKSEATTKKPSANNTTAATTAEPVQTTTEVQEEPTSKYDAEFSLSETPHINITNGGNYIIRGSASDGQIYVDTETEEKVEITLDGVDLSCPTSSAILINQAKRCIIKLAEGSNNYLRDGGNDKINDGVIFSNDTLRIKGKGSLEINSGNAHGIASDDDVIIESGTYIINAVKTGITAHDDITINGGDLQISGGTNGIKSKGTVNINGGTMRITGGNKEEKSSVYAAAAFYYTGGNVIASGNKVTAPASTPNPYVVVNYANAATAGSTVELVLNGVQSGSVTPQSDYRCVLMLSPDICVGDTFTAYLNGVASADFSVSEGQNVFTIE